MYVLITIGLLTSCIAQGIAALLLIAIVKEAIAWPVVFLLGVTWGNKLTIFLAAAMQFTRKDIAASMYSIYMAFTNAGIAVGNLISNSLVEGSIFPRNVMFLAFGFVPTYIFVGSLSILTALLMPVMFYGDYLQLIHKEHDQLKEQEAKLRLVEDAFRIEEVESEEE